MVLEFMHLEHIELVPLLKIQQQVVQILLGIMFMQIDIQQLPFQMNHSV